MPAIPIADSRAPIVVGISATSRAIRVVTESSVFANAANGRSDTTTNMKTSVSAASRMPSAISFGVLRRSAPSTRAIIRSRNDFPGSWVISTTIRSDSTLVLPVTALRSPPASRITGADSPVIADSSTEAMPSITVPSPGIVSPASTTTTSPRTSSEDGLVPPSRSFATVSVRIARRVSAWALPRPSASASAPFANTTVSHSQIAMLKVNQAASWPPPNGVPPNTWISQATVVITAPISTTNITGLRIWTRGSSFRSDATSAGRTISGSKGIEAGSRSCGGCLLVECEVELQHVHAGLAEQRPGSGRRCGRRSARRPATAAGGGRRRSGAPGSGRLPRRSGGRPPMPTG